MEPIDVECPFCNSSIGVPCRNPQGGPLGYQGSRQKNGIHNDRHVELSRVTSQWEDSSQGYIKALVRDHQALILRIQIEPPKTAVEAANKTRMLRSYRNRHSLLWSLLKAENRPPVDYVVQPKKKDVPHPELIDCPKCGCKRGEKCQTRYGDYHLERIRKSP